MSIYKKYQEYAISIVGRKRSMKTIKCDCPLCLQNDSGHYWCRRFADFCDQENVDLCKQLGKEKE